MAIGPGSASQAVAGSPPARGQTAQAVVAGVVAAVVGFASSFAVVLAGFAGVGATPNQAASGLLVSSLAMGVACVGFSWRTRLPITFAWSLPGAALMAGAARPDGGYADAVGAFVLAGLLYLLTGLVRPLGALVERIPQPLANAMLAGILLSLVSEPFAALGHDPGAIAPVILTWLVLLRLAPRWAVPGALAAAVVVIVASGSLAAVDTGALAPHLTWTTPSFDPVTLISLALPLYLVTMTGQNIPGVAVMATLDYRVPLSPALVYSGAVTVLGAGAGGYSTNLSAVSAALAAGPVAGPDPRRRWPAGVSTGVTYLVLGGAAAAVTAVAGAAPAGVIAAVAGVALLATFGNAAGNALADPTHRVPAALTFVVAASGLTIGGVGSAFWALLAGGLYLLVVGTSER